MTSMSRQLRERRLRLLAKPTILVVERDVAIRGLLLEMLEGEGFEVVSTGDGREALDLARGDERRIDLLLTEVNPCGMHVQELTRELYRLHARIKILFMEGKFDEGTAYILGNQAERLFLLKPLTRLTLLQKINDIL